MRRIWWAVAVAVACLVAVGVSDAAAQRTTGDIRGVVTDASGAVLPGVTVTLRGASVQGTPIAVTNESGVYRFPNLAPGTYEVTAELAGFATKTQTGIPVALGATQEVPVQMSVSTQQETITVTAEAPVVDSASTQVATNYTREWVENIPVRRFTFFDLINASPGVSQSTQTSSRSQAFGSAANENLYLLDGTDFTAPYTGAAWPWPNTDAIEEVQVLSLGASAEYGNVAGAVFNIVTRQGSNQFHGDTNFYYQNSGLTGINTNDKSFPASQTDKSPYNRARFGDSTTQLGGPILQDKLWFFGSFQYQEDWESQPGTPKEFPAKSNAKRYFWKLNYSINQNHRLQVQTHDDFYEIPERATGRSAPSSIALNSGHNPSPGVLYTAVLNPTTVFEARYSGFYGTADTLPLNGGPKIARRFQDLDTGNITGGISYWYEGNSFKTAFAGKVTKYADNFLGAQHDFKVGVQYNSGGGENLNGPNDYIYTYGSTPAYGYTQNPYWQGGRMRGLGVYVDDTVRVGRLTLNLGVRYDYNKGYFNAFDLLDRNENKIGRSQAVDKLFDWNVISPRVGATIKLNDDGRTLLKGSVGRYYRGVVTSEFDNATPSVSPRFEFSGLYSAAGVPLGQTLVSDNSNLRIDPGFENPYTDQFIVSFEHQLTSRVGVAVSGVYKNSDNQSGWRDIGGTYARVQRTAEGKTFDLQQLTSGGASRIFQLTNPGDMSSTYRGVHFQVNKRMSNRWQATVGVTLSRSEGRLGSTNARSSATTNANSTAGTFGQNPNDYVNSDGLLLGDRPVVFKASGVYEIGWGTTIAGNYGFQSGRPWGREIRFTGLVPGATRVLYEPLSGDRRVDPLNQLDLRLEKALSFSGGKVEGAVFGDLLNVFNNDAAQSVLDRRSTSANFGFGSAFVLPRRLMLGAKFRF
ncbi:MAG: TonB-dependent receptor [Acidobacteria bacterium]|nr:TonB-dependent receptor [Acidobacteriota bacterium]